MAVKTKVSGSGTGCTTVAGVTDCPIAARRPLNLLHECPVDQRCLARQRQHERKIAESDQWLIEAPLRGNDCGPRRHGFQRISHQKHAMTDCYRQYSYQAAATSSTSGMLA